ncbi:hypothetical protein AO371_1232 [Moraxella catarrhalis]|nr:hypothetical protein AO378_1168 [Moraxella catarrhalis]OAV14262.1 hypothetical protein AO380_0074 [Moraxella catarrhalis]OAV23741.1 hypothetical protein AO371_1232 [Moraxella catarrhalis]OAV31254.1 hypothetical protein AO367_0534 [Moraxella catarrhalis]
MLKVKKTATAIRLDGYKPNLILSIIQKTALASLTPKSLPIYLSFNKKF